MSFFVEIDHTVTVELLSARTPRASALTVARAVENFIVSRKRGIACDEGENWKILNANEKVEV